MILNLVLIAMILALLIPMYEAWQDDDIWQKMLAFARHGRMMIFGKKCWHLPAWRLKHQS